MRKQIIPSYLAAIILEAVENPKVLKHWKGKAYPYLGKGVDATTGEPQIYYMEPDGTAIYNRTPMEMYKDVENYQGQQVPRFILEEVTYDTAAAN